jgi:RNA polymerase sigma-70 factor (ECF subfamily)
VETKAQAVASSAAWTQLVAHEPALRSWLVRRCRNASELDDVVQETLLRAARSSVRGHDPRRFSAWLARIANNTLNDWIRREGRARRASESALDPDEIAAPDAVRECEMPPDDEPCRLGRHVVPRSVARAHLESVLRGLREHDRIVLAAYYREGRSCAETAATCGIAPKLVKVRLYRARQRVIREVERRLSQPGRESVAFDGSFN